MEKAFDSGGVLQDFDKIHLVSQQHSLGGLNQLRTTLLPYLAKLGANDYTFDYVFQPLYLEDRLLCFTKLYVEGDNPLIRIAKEAQKNPDYEYQDEQQKAIFNSVFNTMENGKNAWYVLYAETVCLTRNMCDGQYISVNQEMAVPYYSFFEQAKKEMLTEQELTMEKEIYKKMFVSTGKAYIKPETLLKIALPRKKDNNYDGYMAAGLKKYRELYLSGRDAYSNKKSELLSLIKDSVCRQSETFEFFRDLQHRLKDVSFHYEDNMITVAAQKNKGRVFVFKESKDSPLGCIANGQIFKKPEDLEKYISDGKIFEKVDWFEQMNDLIVPAPRQKPQYRSQRDVTGYTELRHGINKNKQK